MTMNKIIPIIIALLNCTSAIAQNGIDALVQAEKDFAAYSVAHTTKEAFQKYIDSNSIMFDNGKAVNAVEIWNKRENRPGILNWRPQFAEISASGDFGYTTGPWTFQATANDTIVGRGQYSTVWHVDKNGDWKFLVDFGINNTQVNNKELRIINAPKEIQNDKIITHVYPLVMADQNFNAALAKKKAKAFQGWLSKESILTRIGYLPAATVEERKVIIDATPSNIQYTMIGWGVSSVPDMGYTYGTATKDGKTNNYFRIWRLEKGGWRIALEVLRY